MATRIFRDDIDKFLEYDIHIPTRTFYMGSCFSYGWEGGDSGVDSAMAERVVKGLHILDRLPVNGVNPGITIIMNNPGGNVYHGLAIFDAIQGCENHVTVVATGYVMSMGSIIFQAADERLMTPNAKMMIHHGSDGGEGHTKNFIAWADEAKAIVKWVNDLFLAKMQEKHPDMTYEEVDRMQDFDKYLTAQGAVDLGLADGIKYPPNHFFRGNNG